MLKTTFCNYEVHITDSELDEPVLLVCEDATVKLPGKACVLYGSEYYATVLARQLQLSIVSDSDKLLEAMKANEGFLFHNYPKTVEELVKVQATLATHGLNLHIAIFLDQSLKNNTTEANAETITESMSSLFTELGNQDLLFWLCFHKGQPPGANRISSKIMEILRFPDRFVHRASAYAKLSLRFRLRSPGSDNIEPAMVETLRPLARAFRDAAAEENIAKRTGARRRFVYVATSNALKLAEFVQTFDRYGVEVLQVPPDCGEAFIAALLLEADSDMTPVAFLREESLLLRPGAFSRFLPPPAVPDHIPGTTPHSNEPLSSITSPPTSSLVDAVLAGAAGGVAGVLSSVRDGVRADHLSVMRAWLPPAGGGDSGGAGGGGAGAGKAGGGDGRRKAGGACGVGVQTYTHVTPGRVRRSGGGAAAALAAAAGGVVFGWDDEFVVLATGLTYQEHLRTGLKVSSRSMVLSAFLQDHIHYKSLRGLNHAQLSLRRPVDFDSDVADFALAEPLYATAAARAAGLGDMLAHVLNEGIFFKCAETRIEANYWQPGLNAGIPLVPKRDAVHERTFMFHDFGHFLMKDLLFTGRDTAAHRRVYIASRMISEAVTIMLADGVFVDTLRREGVDYDFATRRIYPLFSAAGLDFTSNAAGTCFVENLRAITKASVDYTCKGDDSSFRRLLAAKGQSDDVLEAYKEKFKPFFVSDLEWTAHNYDNMASRCEEMRRWWSLTEPARKLLDVRLETIDDFLQSMGLDPAAAAAAAAAADGEDDLAIVDQVFDHMFDRYVAPVFRRAAEAGGDALPLAPAAVRLRRGFLRYMIGQMGVFARYATVPEAPAHLARVTSLLQAGADVGAVRGAYEAFLAVLRGKSLISADDERNFREVYPLFEPFYVSYDKREAYPDLAALARRILRPAAHRDHQAAAAARFFGRPAGEALPPPARRFHEAAATLVEAAGGQIEDGVFVTSPGVALIAATAAVTDDAATPEERAEVGIDPATLHATFLLSGVALETAMELVAHGEAAVARLTSSKTKAMSFPLFRVPQPPAGGGLGEGSGCGGGGMEDGGAARGMMAYLKLVQAGRAAFEAAEEPRERWADGVELYNQTAPGCKATALVYTMPLPAFHRLFIGRIGPAGNEREVREVVGRMAAALHARYPHAILPPDGYLALANGAKYAADARPAACGAARGGGGAGAAAAVAVAAETRLTAAGRRILRAVHVDVTEGDAHALAELSSRITYLAFAAAPPAAGAARAYVRKVVREMEHLSVLSAYRLSLSLPAAPPAAARRACALAARIGGGAYAAAAAGPAAGGGGAAGGGLLLSMSLKQLHAWLCAVGGGGQDDSDAGVAEVRGVGRAVAEVLASRCPFVFDGPARYGL